MSRRCLPLLLCTLLLGVLHSRADYLVVQRHALVKGEPEREAETLRVVEEGDMLPLAAGDQTNGYYEVLLDDDQTGWVYRTFVRRWPGEIPDTSDSVEPSDGANEQPSSGGAPSVDVSPDATAGADHNIVFGTPRGSASVAILQNVGYTVGYSAETRTPLWVSYRLFAVGSNKKSPARDDVFAADLRVPDPVGKNDYAGSGYDRGHMAPSAPIGRRYGKDAQDATFLMTNMAPQLHGLNQRGWEALESVISSDYAEDFGEVWVFVGPIFEGQCRELLSGVRIPSHCYMIVVDIDETTNQARALAVIMPQRRINAEILSDFVVTVDQIETRTGLDFLSELSDDIEQQLEAGHPASVWNVDQILQPRFAATARTLRTRACN